MPYPCCDDTLCAPGDHKRSASSRSGMHERNSTFTDMALDEATKISYAISITDFIHLMALHTADVTGCDWS